MAKSSSVFFSMFICFILITFAPSAESQAQSCDYGQAQAIVREKCKCEDTSFCQQKCQKLSSALVLGGYGCERKDETDTTDSWCVCCFELDLCDSAGSWLSSFSPKLLFKGLRQ